MTKINSRKILISDEGNKQKIMVADVFPIFAHGLINVINARETTLFLAKELEVQPLLNEIDLNRPDAVIVSCETFSDVHILNLIQSVVQSESIPVFALTDSPRTTPLTPYLDGEITVIPRNSRPDTILDIFSNRIKCRKVRRSQPAANKVNYQRSILTRCEKIVLRAILEGKSQVEIAHLTNRSIKTISTQKMSAKKRLGFRTDIDLYRFLTSPAGKECLH
ncbi:helix-turn-helix domain-containing protein [Pantoea agglomerans]